MSCPLPSLSPHCVGIVTTSDLFLPSSHRPTSMDKIHKCRWKLMEMQIMVVTETSDMDAMAAKMAANGVELVLSLTMHETAKMEASFMLPMETCRTKNTVSSMQQARIWGNSREEGSEKLRRMILKVLNDAYATELVQEPLYSDTNGMIINSHGLVQRDAFAKQNVPFTLLSLLPMVPLSLVHERYQSILPRILNELCGRCTIPPAVEYLGESVDLVIFARHVVPVEPMNVVLDQHAIVIQDGKIVDLLEWEKAYTKYNPTSISNQSRHIVFPGFVNAHTHATMTLLRGLSDDKNLCDWLTQDIWPAENKFVSPEFVADGTVHSVAEMLRCGTTCYNDMYFYPGASAEKLVDIGMRAVLGQVIFNFPSMYASGPEEYFELAKSCHANDIAPHFPLIRSAISPHAPYTVSDENLQKVQKLAEEMDWSIHVHLHEGASECNDSENGTPSMNKHLSEKCCRPLQNFKEMGMLSNRLIAAHMTNLNDEEIRWVAEARVNVVHCPTSNLKLSSGFCPITKLVAAGVNVAIGTDGAASNNGLNMFAEMKLAAILAKAESRDCTAIPAAQALRMATLNGAIALGMGDEIGSIEIGKFADLTAVNIDCIEMLPMFNVISHLVYVASRENVSDVWVAGKQLLRDRHLTTIDPFTVASHCTKWHDLIREFHDKLTK